MEPLTWTGSLSGLNIIFTAVLVLLALGIVAQILISFVPQTDARAVAGDGTMASNQGASGFINMIVNYLFYALVGITLIYLVLGVVMGTGAGILGGMARQFLPVWTALIVTFVVSITFKRKLGLYGKLFDSTVGMIGFAIVMFWVFTGVFGGVFDLLVTHDSLSQVSGMKNKLPGTPLRGAEEGDYQWFLLGGDNLARDVFSRLIKGSWVVVKIAPFATLFAFMVGITLGLPAGYYGGRLDTILSFLANLILAFPVILLFYLLVTPEIVLTGIPNYMALFLFIFPLVFLAILLNSRFYTQPSFRTPLLIVVLGVGAWLYLSMVSSDGTIVETPSYSIPGIPAALDLFDIGSGILVVFVSVVFVNSPTVFRIVRGLALDIKTRDYVAAAQTRGEGPWYIMLWEILPNARGPLIVDFCLRIGYTTILLGTLGFFGLGLESESPDWGSTINAGRRLLSLYPHAAIAPALSLLSLVLGLNLLADGLREESLRD
ncbi:ABC transporter permease [Sulfitobacter mediterraneus]|uniref:ABC transporter permease n=1 Tax=Sulfitobacter mediterraneus TaxID=83219 RepID=UPI00193A240D|nr:ABC transporter permease [Sulfitobacter mediterraneus]MBM1556725.1 ABC transporter permease [Sulfitobacter mediterraneus]MBM1568909.1 ABC transporter permease [Sulfitobacter mediterraneus]MBM1572337.1 ABC transporter permease [Sulfitobacter mediterraneus]MBM1576500.1 ABC transporter permease [Sulfitobacter mediterraneus]MBM1579683.1 ABC transporter permease [Sulfitobacter mediterraneus]